MDYFGSTNCSPRQVNVVKNVHKYSDSSLTKYQDIWIYSSVSSPQAFLVISGSLTSSANVFCFTETQSQSWGLPGPKRKKWKRSPPAPWTSSLNPNPRTELQSENCSRDLWRIKTKPLFVYRQDAWLQGVVLKESNEERHGDEVQCPQSQAAAQTSSSPAPPASPRSPNPSGTQCLHGHLSLKGRLFISLMFQISRRPWALG